MYNVFQSSSLLSVRSGRLLCAAAVLALTTLGVVEKAFDERRRLVRPGGCRSNGGGDDSCGGDGCGSHSCGCDCRDGGVLQRGRKRSRGRRRRSERALQSRIDRDTRYGEERVLRCAGSGLQDLQGLLLARRVVPS